MADFLKNECKPNLMSMIGYTLRNTLSDYGTVNRGVCAVDKKNNLIEVVERIKIANQNGKVKYNIGSDEESGELNPDFSVSMNYWGFHPSIFKEIEYGLHNFIKENSKNPTAEYYIPNIVTDMIVSNKMSVRVIPTNDNWFGVTYKEDKPMAVAEINKYIKSGIYPKNLWD